MVEVEVVVMAEVEVKVVVMVEVMIVVDEEVIIRSMVIIILISRKTQMMIIEGRFHKIRNLKVVKINVSIVV